LSYSRLASADRYLHGADIVIPGVLKHFDLPHVAAALANRPLAVLSPVDEMKQDVEIPVARRAFEWTRATYAAAGAVSELRVLGRDQGLDSGGEYIFILNDQVRERRTS